MSLSKEERRILEEMERGLLEADRSPAGHARRRDPAPQRGTLLAVVAFIGGFAVLLSAFGSSVLVASLGFVVMLLAVLVFAGRSRTGRTGSGPPGR